MGLFVKSVVSGPVEGIHAKINRSATASQLEAVSSMAILKAWENRKRNPIGIDYPTAIGSLGHRR